MEIGQRLTYNLEGVNRCLNEENQIARAYLLKKQVEVDERLKIRQA
jgi:hypothetical protein